MSNVFDQNVVIPKNVPILLLAPLFKVGPMIHANHLICPKTFNVKLILKYLVFMKEISFFFCFSYLLRPIVTSLNKLLN